MYVNSLFIYTDLMAGVYWTFYVDKPCEVKPLFSLKKTQDHSYNDNIASMLFNTLKLYQTFQDKCHILIYIHKYVYF